MLTLQAMRIIWWFPIGLPLVIIHLRLGFSRSQKPCMTRGTPMTVETSICLPCSHYVRYIYILPDWINAYNIYIYTHACIVYITFHPYPIQDLPTIWFSQDVGFRIKKEKKNSRPFLSRLKNDKSVLGFILWYLMILWFQRLEITMKIPLKIPWKHPIVTTTTSFIPKKYPLAN